jgi:exoribonuclease R
MNYELYTINIHDREYKSFDICTMTNPVINLSINPFESKLFSGDVFSFDANNQVHLNWSSVRMKNSSLPGVLILADNKTYGRKNKKLLYKCVPDDVRLPAFLVPYEIKHIGFSKKSVNLYVTFSYVEWTEKHPHGQLNQTIGPVDILCNFYEYQLYCKQLNISIQKFQKNTIDALKNKIPETILREKYPTVEMRALTHRVFSIDPDGSLDFDDAFSIAPDATCDTASGSCVISVYIANVSMWLDALELWDSFTQRVSTIYLPDKKRPMLPSILSDNLCSLKEGELRPALYMDLFTKNGNIVSVKYGNCFVKLYKNYCYEESALLSDPEYTQLMDTTMQLSKKASYLTHIKDSHDIVAYLMILMNYHCAKTLMHHKTGIFRSLTMNGCHLTPAAAVPDEVGNFLKIINSAQGKYIDITCGTQDIRHELLDLDAYVHITSPIRRLVDLINMIRFQVVVIDDVSFMSESAVTFANRWTSDLDLINAQMKSIRKVQNDCNLLDLCTRDSHVLNTIYDGYIFNKTIRDDGLFKYQVFLPQLKMLSQMKTSVDYVDYECKQFKLFMFNDQERFKQKIRLHVTDSK